MKIHEIELDISKTPEIKDFPHSGLFDINGKSIYYINKKWGQVTSIDDSEAFKKITEYSEPVRPIESESVLLESQSPGLSEDFVLKMIAIVNNKERYKDLKKED